jgi:6-phosphogluconolactonase (cycloisomerase 2 family)
MAKSYLSPYSLLVHASNKYLYVANEGSSKIAAYSISSGTISPLSTAAYGGVTDPNFIVGDSSGKYLFVGNQSSSPGITVFSVDNSTGALTQESSYSTASSPGEMFISQ